MKKYRLNQKGKERLALIIWIFFISIIVFIATQIYMQRIEDINNGKIIVVPDSKCDE